jgi:hypothetical protein
MPNAHVLNRLSGIQAILNGVHLASATMSTNTKGAERQSFIGNRSGQLDVVIEYPFSPALPSVSGGAATTTTRLYLAESIASVVEVKSDVSKQWDEVVRTASALASVKRAYGATMSMGLPPSPAIPLFVASYTGWKTLAAVQTRMATTPDVAGILIIDSGLFVGSNSYGGIQATGPWALWGLICTLHLIANSLQAASTNPLSYAL